MAEVKEDGARTGSQGDRQGRPYQKTVPFNPFACSGTGDPGGRPAGRLSACTHHQNLTRLLPELILLPEFILVGPALRKEQHSRKVSGMNSKKSSSDYLPLYWISPLLRQHLKVPMSNQREA